MDWRDKEPTLVPVERRLHRADSEVGSSIYSFRRYASSAARSSGNGWRLKVTPSVDATGGAAAQAE